MHARYCSLFLRDSCRVMTGRIEKLQARRQGGGQMKEDIREKSMARQRCRCVRRIYSPEQTVELQTHSGLLHERSTPKMCLKSTHRSEPAGVRAISMRLQQRLAVAREGWS